MNNNDKYTQAFCDALEVTADKLPGHMSIVFDGTDASLPLQRSALGRKLCPLEVAEVVLAMTDEKMRMVNG